MQGLTWLNIRRFFDVIYAAVAVVVLSPLMLVIAVIISCDGGTVFFLQSRLGRKGQPFIMIKFRSMIVDADSFLDDRGLPLKNRITPFGFFLRRSSLDELPQLFNIIKGDMALIGPRPILPHILNQLGGVSASINGERFAAYPGITGLAQVKGRHMIPWGERFDLDCLYVKTATPMMDAVIVFLTIKQMVFASGFAADRDTDLGEQPHSNDRRPKRSLKD